MLSRKSIEVSMFIPAHIWVQCYLWKTS